MMNYIQRPIYLLLTLAFGLACFMAFTIYSPPLSQRLPWYEGDTLRFLGLFIACPAMGAIGVAEVVLGRFMKLNWKTQALPFATAAILFLLPFISEGNSLPIAIVGSLISVAAAVAAAALCVLDMIHAGSPKRVAGRKTKTAVASQ